MMASMECEQAWTSSGAGEQTAQQRWPGASLGREGGDQETIASRLFPSPGGASYIAATHGHDVVAPSTGALVPINVFRRLARLALCHCARRRFRQPLPAPSIQLLRRNGIYTVSVLTHIHMLG